MPEEPSVGSAPDLPATLDTNSPTVVQLSRWRAGDERAFDEIHQRSLPWLRVRVHHHAVWPLLADSMQPEDVLQEVWARAFAPVRERFQHGGGGSLFAYLGSIADRVMIDLVRTQGAKKRGPIGGAHSLPSDLDGLVRPRPGQSVVETPTSAAREHELRALARRALDDQHFDVWELVESAGFTAEEAGLAIGKSGAAVRGILFRARAKLSSLLTKDQEGGDRQQKPGT